MGSQMPVVRVSISVDLKGEIVNSYIIEKSGISSMDLSVRHLLRRLTFLPKPPKGAMTIKVSLELSGL